MFQNFKTDIIYYNTPTDFELEFNLCGCCRMRLLNDKCSDKKNLLLSLSRAVSRSRVIIITAPLFSEDNIIRTVAAAIGSDVEKIDNSAHNINSAADIYIIKNSVPLVTNDGIFGGCIIESGPQSLILLTESKSVRKVIMRDLIHPYIIELSYQRIQTPENDDLILDEPTQEIEDTEQEIEVPEEEENALIIESNETETEEPDTEQPEFDETAPENQIISDLSFDDSDAEQELSHYYEEGDALFIDTSVSADSEESEEVDYTTETDYYTEEDEQPVSSAFNFWFIFISVIILLALIVLCYCIFYVPAKQGLNPSDYLRDVLNTVFK